MLNMDEEDLGYAVASVVADGDAVRLGGDWECVGIITEISMGIRNEILIKMLIYNWSIGDNRRRKRTRRMTSRRGRKGCCRTWKFPLLNSVIIRSFNGRLKSSHPFSHPSIRVH